MHVLQIFIASFYFSQHSRIWQLRALDKFKIYLSYRRQDVHKQLICIDFFINVTWIVQWNYSGCIAQSHRVVCIVAMWVLCLTTLQQQQLSYTWLSNTCRNDQRLFPTESFGFLKIFEQNRKTKHLWSKLKLFQQNILSISVQIGWHRSSSCLLCSPHILVLSSQNSFFQLLLLPYKLSLQQTNNPKDIRSQHIRRHMFVQEMRLFKQTWSQESPVNHRGIQGTLFTVLS